MEDPFKITPDMDITTYYKTISAKGKVVMAEKRARGEQMHLAPLGYKNARDEHGRAILVPDPETYELVQEAKRLRAEGMSIRIIARFLFKMGISSRGGNVPSPSRVRNLLLNEIHMLPRVKSGSKLT